MVQVRSGGVDSDPLPFALGWTAMMAAMMLPSVAPVASLYVRSLGGARMRLALFVAGYLAVWGATSVPALLAMNASAELTARFPAARAVTAAALVLVGAYQLSPWKTVCLERCRSPLSLLLQYAARRGPLRDVGAGAHHGAYCLGCCWPLMLLLPVVGMMNVALVVLLAAFVVAEKNLTRGRALTRAGAVAALAAALAVLLIP